MTRVCEAEKQAYLHQIIGPERIGGTNADFDIAQNGLVQDYWPAVLEYRPRSAIWPSAFYLLNRHFAHIMLETQGWRMTSLLALHFCLLVAGMAMSTAHNRPQLGVERQIEETCPRRPVVGLVVALSCPQGSLFALEPQFGAMIASSLRVRHT